MTPLPRKLGNKKIVGHITFNTSQEFCSIFLVVPEPTLATTLRIIGGLSIYQCFDVGALCTIVQVCDLRSHPTLMEIFEKLSSPPSHPPSNNIITNSLSSCHF